MKGSEAMHAVCTRPWASIPSTEGDVAQRTQTFPGLRLSCLTCWEVHISQEAEWWKVYNMVQHMENFPLYSTFPKPEVNKPIAVERMWKTTCKFSMPESRQLKASLGYKTKPCHKWRVKKAGLSFFFTPMGIESRTFPVPDSHCVTLTTHKRSFHSKRSWKWD